MHQCGNELLALPESSVLMLSLLGLAAKVSLCLGWHASGMGWWDWFPGVAAHNRFQASSLGRDSHEALED
jgi:hypothetical protein